MKILLERYYKPYYVLCLQSFGATFLLLWTPAFGVSTREGKKQNQIKFKFKNVCKNRS